jgi:hypothetical protein
MAKRSRKTDSAAYRRIFIKPKNFCRIARERGRLLDNAGTITGALRSFASIKPKYLPNRPGDGRFLD